MILVLLGTQNNSFSRLLFKIEQCIKDSIIKDDVIVQAGSTKFDSSCMKIFDFCAKDEMDNLISSADVIITHGGVGSIVKAIKLGKKVVAVPRLKKFGEHVNDHQIQIIENFDKCGYIKGVIDLNNLGDTLTDINSFVPIPFINNFSNVEELISNYIDNN